MHVDRASNSESNRAELILTNSDGVVTKYALWFDFNTSNNMAKYEVLIASVNIAKELRVEQFKAFTDLQLVTGHVQGEYEAQKQTMVKYVQRIMELSLAFKKFKIQ